MIHLKMKFSLPQKLKNRSFIIFLFEKMWTCEDTTSKLLARPHSRRSGGEPSMARRSASLQPLYYDDQQKDKRKTCDVSSAVNWKSWLESKFVISIIITVSECYGMNGKWGLPAWPILNYQTKLRKACSFRSCSLSAAPNVWDTQTHEDFCSNMHEDLKLLKLLTTLKFGENAKRYGTKIGRNSKSMKWNIRRSYKVISSVLQNRLRIQ